MALRFAKAEDKKSIEEIMAYCFYEYRQSAVEKHITEHEKAKPESEEKKRENEDKKRENEEKLRWVLLNEDENGKVGQHVAIVPLTISFYGGTQPMGGIGGVASLPEYRYGGGVMALLRMSLQVMHERAYPFSELAPFSYEFYRKCGWELGFQWHELRIPMKELAIFKKDSGTFLLLTEALSEQAMNVRNLHSMRFNGAEQVEISKIKESLSKKDLLGYGVLGEDGQLSGYVQYRMKDRTIYCRDFFYRDIHAKRQLLHFFHRHNSQADLLQLTVPDSDTTQHLLGDQYIDVTIKSGMMVRVVDVPLALAAMKVNARLTGSLVIQVNDETAPWNHGNWLITVSDGHIHAEMKSDLAADCEISIQRLSQLVYGFLSGRDVSENGMMGWRNETAQDLFNELFQKRPTAQWVPF